MCINSLLILFFLSSFWVSGIQGAEGPTLTNKLVPTFHSQPYDVRVPEKIPVGSIVQSMPVGGVDSTHLDCVISNHGNGGSRFFAVEKEGTACLLKVVQSLTLSLYDKFGLTIEARNTHNGAFASAHCGITVVETLRCKDSINVTVNSNIEKDVQFVIPCQSAGDVYYTLRVPTRDLHAVIDYEAGKITVDPRVPCGVDYDYMSIRAMDGNGEEVFDIMIHFYIQHTANPPRLQLLLMNVTGSSADFIINITQPRTGSGCSNAGLDLSYQFVLEVTKGGELAVPTDVFEKSTTSLKHTVWGLEPGTSYVASLRTEGHFNSSAAPVAFSTATDENTHNYTVTETYRLLRTWETELANESSPDFLLTKFYVEDLIDHLMIHRPSYYDSEVLSFEPDGMRVSLTDRVNQPGQTTDIAQNLERQFNSVFETTDTWTSENLKGITLKRTLPSSLPIIEGSSVELSCIFIVVHSLDIHNFQISWQLDGNAINFDASQTMQTEKERIVFTSNNTGGLDIGKMKTYFYRYNLNIDSFRSRHTGQYSCHMTMMTWNEMPSSLIEDTLYTDICEDHLLKPAHVAISPLIIYASKDSTVTLKCTFSNANRIVFVDHENKVLKTHISQSTQGIVEMSVNSSLHNQVQCQGRLEGLPMLLSKSEFVNIVLLEKDSSQCSLDVDDAGLRWEDTKAGQTAVQACPSGYQGYASRLCLDDGSWKGSNFINCIRDNWIVIGEEIRKVKEDGIVISSDFVNTAATMTWASLNNSSFILSSDIQQVANILNDLGFLTSRNEEEALMDYQALDNLASISDKILSSSDKQWEDVLQYDKNNSMMGSGNKIIVAMDQLVASSMKTPSMPSVPIIREKIAIKPSTLVIDDIDFPDASHREYQSYDGWVIESGNTAFLSGSALKTDGIRYSAILLRDVTLKMSVDPGRQNLGESIWSSEGCETVVSGSDTVHCLCSHLTNFAILMSPTGSLNEKHEILSAITYVGCGISILFLLMTVAIHFSVWRYIKGDRVELHVHLSICLLLSFITFLAGIKRTENEIVCTVIAALLHYLFLSSFFLMLGEGIHIFLSVTIVFHHKSWLLKLLLLAYGVPLLIVGACLGITQSANYRRDDFCWLDRQSGAVWAFIGPAAGIILVNFIIFGLVVKAVLRDQSAETVETRSEAKSMMRALCVLSPILGLAWVFGLLAVNEDLVAFQYLFAIFNSLQGFFIFLFHCAFSSQVRNAIKASRRKRRAKSLDHIAKSSSSSHEITAHKRQMNGKISESEYSKQKLLFKRFRLKRKYMTARDAEARARKQSSSSTLSVIEAESYANPAYDVSPQKKVFFDHKSCFNSLHLMPTTPPMQT